MIYLHYQTDTFLSVLIVELYKIVGIIDTRIWDFEDNDSIEDIDDFDD